MDTLAARVALILLALVGLAGATAPARVGVLGPDEEPRFSDLARGLAQGLREQGQERVDIIETRVRRGDRAAATAAITELTRRHPGLAFVVGSELARLAREAAPELPIVFITPGDPVESGLVSTLAHPGGNATGMTFEYPELSGKRLQLLVGLTPRVRRILVLFDPRDASSRQHVVAARTAAASAGVTLVERSVRAAEELARALDDLRDADGVLGLPGGVAGSHVEQVIRAANQARLPTVVPGRGPRVAEALASYGASDVEIAREAARLVYRILRGARAGDLPVERPTRIGLTLNLKTAERLGISIPPTMRVMADTVIE